MVKSLDEFIEKYCAGKQYDSCSPCLYAGGPSRTSGGLECRHPEHPNNDKKEDDQREEMPKMRNVDDAG